VRSSEQATQCSAAAGCGRAARACNQVAAAQARVDVKELRPIEQPAHRRERPGQSRVTVVRGATIRPVSAWIRCAVKHELNRTA